MKKITPHSLHSLFRAAGAGLLPAPCLASRYWGCRDFVKLLSRERLCDERESGCEGMKEPPEGKRGTESETSQAAVHRLTKKKGETHKRRKEESGRQLIHICLNLKQL